MKSNTHRNDTICHSKSVGFVISSTLRENLSKAIHGAFEVALETAVSEVTQIMSLAVGEMFDSIWHENEILKEQLLKAQSIVDSVSREEGSLSPQNGELLSDISVPIAAVDGVYESDTEQENTLSTEHQENEENGQHYPSKGSIQEILHDFVEVKSENRRQLCMGEEADCPPAAYFPDDGAPQLVKVKEEKPEETPIASDCLGIPYKEDVISQLQSGILQDWTPGASHFESDENKVTLQAHSQEPGHSSNMNFRLDNALEASSSLNVNFPVPVSDQASTQDPPLIIYGSHSRINQGNAKASPPTCKLCGLTFTLPSLLRRHYGQCQQKLCQRVHLPAVGGKRTKLQLYPPGCSPFRCSVCNREFNRLENLKTHLRIHTGERPYQCSVCSTSFRHSGALTRHFRIHTGEKPYVCGLCGKSFRNCGGLKFHQRSHNKQL